MRKINGLEHGVLKQSIEQSVHARQQVKGAFFEGLNEFGKVPGVGHQGQV